MRTMRLLPIFESSPNAFSIYNFAESQQKIIRSLVYIIYMHCEGTNFNQCHVIRRTSSVLSSFPLLYCMFHHPLFSFPLTATPLPSTESVETIPTHRPTTRSAFRAPIHWQPLPTHVSLIPKREIEKVYKYIC